MSAGDLHHLAGAFALDALDDDERQAFEAHYPTCDICSSEVADYRAVAGELAAARAEQPPVALRERTLAEIAGVRQEAPRTGPIDQLAQRRNRRVVPAILGAAAALLLVTIGAVVLVMRGDDPSTDDRYADIVAAADAELVALDGSGEGTISVAWSAERGELAILGTDLATVNESETYELWRFDGDAVHPAGLFRPDEDGRVLVVTELDGAPTGWGVTVEPEGGSESPTGDVLFAAQT